MFSVLECECVFFLHSLLYFHVYSFFFFNCPPTVQIDKISSSTLFLSFPFILFIWTQSPIFLRPDFTLFFLFSFCSNSTVLFFQMKILSLLLLLFVLVDGNVVNNFLYPLLTYLFSFYVLFLTKTEVIKNQN